VLIVFLRWPVLRSSLHLTDSLFSDGTYFTAAGALQFVPRKPAPFESAFQRLEQHKPKTIACKRSAVSHTWLSSRNLPCPEDARRSSINAMVDVKKSITRNAKEKATSL